MNTTSSPLHSISLVVNGQSYRREVPAQRTLLEFLREDLDLTGTKEGCGNGECGACTIILNGLPLRSCLILAVEADGASILTIEGMAAQYNKEHKSNEEDQDSLHPLQQAFIETGAVQCGYCAPGFLLASYALLQRSPHPTPAEIDEAFSGHLCRCTGYEAIEQAVLLAARRLAPPS